MGDGMSKASLSRAVRGKEKAPRRRCRFSGLLVFWSPGGSLESVSLTSRQLVREAEAIVAHAGSDAKGFVHTVNKSTCGGRRKQWAAPFRHRPSPATKRKFPLRPMLGDRAERGGGSGRRWAEGKEKLLDSARARPGVLVSAGLPVARRSGESFRPGRTLPGPGNPPVAFGRPLVSREALAVSVSTQSRS
jgi:hypothetical protein